MYIVAYDIENSRERTRVIKIIEQYGIRIQKSVWLCDLGQGKKAGLLRRLERLDLETGIVDIWELHGGHDRIGAPVPVPEPDFCHIV